MIRALWTLLRALRGAMPDPRVAEARRQQQAVAGDVHSRKTVAHWAHSDLCKCRPCTEYQAAAACAERGLYGAAAEWAIRASSEHGTCRVVNPQEAQ